MSGAAYLQRLRSQLKDFAPDEQARLIEEIAAHIEAGENDPGLGQDAAARSGRLEKELGSPDELGRRLRQVHRPGRWFDFFLVVLPTLLIFPLLPWIANGISMLPAQPMQANALVWISIRLGICVQVVLILISLWKASPGVLIHWLASTLLAIIALLLSEIRWPWRPASAFAANRIGLVEVVFWFTALALLMVWLINVARGQRGEPLLILLAVNPFLFAAANYAAGLTLRYQQIDAVDFVIPMIGWFGLFQVSEFLWPALFFLPHKRDLRWAGLLLGPITYVIYNGWPYHSYPLVVSLYLLPACIVLVAWIRDIRARLVPITH